MKKVQQTKFGPIDGNCYAACIASLLEISIEDAECCTCDNDNWHGKVDEFLKKRGLFALAFPVNSESKDFCFPFYCPPSGGLCILSGPSNSGGCEHAVIGEVLTKHLEKSNRMGDGKSESRFLFVHDPMPNGNFLKNVNMIEFLVPFDPAKVA